MSKVKELFGTPWADANKLALSSFDVSQVGSSPSPSKDGDTVETEERDEFEKLITDPWEPKETIDNVLSGAVGVAGKSTAETAAVKNLNTLKKVATDVLEDRETVNHIEQSVWESMLTGEFNPDRFMEHKGMANLVNTLTGGECMETNYDDFHRALNSAMLDKGWTLQDPKFFECLIESFKNMGTEFHNNVRRNTQAILKDQSMVALEGASKVMGVETEQVIPQFKRTLEVFDGKMTGQDILTVMGTVNPTWHSNAQGDLELDTFSNASPTAKTRLSDVEDTDVMFGLTMMDTFDRITDLPPPSMYPPSNFEDRLF